MVGPLLRALQVGLGYFIGVPRSKPMLFTCPEIQSGQPFLASSRQPGWDHWPWPTGVSGRTPAVRVLIAARDEWEEWGRQLPDVDCDSDGYYIPTREE